VLVETRHAHDGTVVTRDDPAQALRQLSDGVVAHREQHQHLVGHEPAQREDEGAHGRLVRPVQVVDDEQHRSRRLQLTEQLEQPAPGEERLRGGVRRHGGQGLPRRARGARQLVEDAVGEQRLRLLAARPKNRGRRSRTLGLRQEPLDQRRLPDPRRPLDLDDPRPPRTGVGEPGTQDVELSGATDERVHANPRSLDGVVSSAGAAPAPWTATLLPHGSRGTCCRGPDGTRRR
jgi:hypothetical protein